ncbi:MAG: prolyl oligopeptidase family serine peptidase [Gemmatimonadetes bacterium]|nr:prolyl oligopeptidase family serine peptidase [Gemmatimonadota bacterium]
MCAAITRPPATFVAAPLARAFGSAAATTVAALTAALPILTATALAALAPLPSQAQQRPFTPEVALDVNQVSIAAVTSDGSRVAATVRTRRDRTDVDHQRFGDPTYISPVSTRLMVIDTRSGERTWVHEEPAQLRGFAWSPDGERLAYFAVEAGAYRLRIFDARAGSAETVAIGTDKEIASSSPLVWAPGGSGVLIGLRPDGWAAEARAAFVALTEAPVIVQDSRNDFLAWDRVRNIAARQITALVSLEDGGGSGSYGSVREVLAGETPSGLGFAADGSYVTYSTATRTKTTYTRRDGTEYALFRLDLADGGEPELLRDTGEERMAVTWNDARDAFAYSEDGSVFVRRLDADEAVDVTAGHRGEPEPADAAGGGAAAGGAGDEEESDADSTRIRFSVQRWSPDGDALLLASQDAWHLLALGGGEMRTLLELEPDDDTRPRRQVQAWSDDGRHIHFSFSARDQWQRGLKRLDVASGDIETLALDSNLYRSWNISDDGGTIVYTMSDGDHPDEIHAARGDLSAARQLTTSNPQLDDIALTRSELIEYLDVDGNTLYGILYYPANYEPGRKYPLVAEIYEQFFDNGFNENMNLITAQGWFGFRPSVRFEEGFPGEAWLKAVPNAINKIIERGLVDPDRVGVYGQSYGGYATNLLITQTDRFAAAANVSGKVNIISFLGDSPKITTRNYAAAEVGQDRIGATLWEQPHKYIEHSAVMFADRIETPLLMLSGEGDWNVPATNQREMYYALRRLGKEVVWVHYTAGGHGAGRASTAADFADHWQRMFEWFAEHFGEEEGRRAATSDR